MSVRGKGNIVVRYEATPSPRTSSSSRQVESLKQQRERHAIQQQSERTKFILEQLEVVFGKIDTDKIK